MSRTKAAGPKTKAATPALPDINWSADDGVLVHALLTEAEKDENRKVLFGKGPDEVCPSNSISVSVISDL